MGDLNMEIEITKLLYPVIAIVCTFFAGKVLNKIDKVLKLINSIITALEDARITPLEIAEIVRNLKEVLKKKNGKA